LPPLHTLESKLAAAWPPQTWYDVTVLLAISGGPDSVALARAMRALNPGGQGRLAAAHLNHRLRGEESEGDEAFVVGLCRRLDIPCEVHRADVGQLAADSRDGLESAARKARYAFLRHTADRLGARYVVTAHTADDQAETVLHRIIRGTGIAGLAGMARARPLGPAATLIRPMLEFRRAELLAYLDELGQPYRVDSSNDDTQYTRNRIRRELLPQLADRFNAAVIDALLRLGSLAGEVQTVVEGLVDDLADQSVTEASPNVVQVNVDLLVGHPRYLVRELLITLWRSQGWPLQSMGFTQWDLLAEMVLACRGDSAGAPRKHVFPGSVLAELVGADLRLERPEC
jgi:tRNA(Ile)-lysidine synthase